MGRGSPSVLMGEDAVQCPERPGEQRYRPRYGRPLVAFQRGDGWQLPGCRRSWGRKVTVVVDADIVVDGWQTPRFRRSLGERVHVLFVGVVVLAVAGLFADEVRTRDR